MPRGAFGADQESSADTQGSAAPDSSSPSWGFSHPLPPGTKTKPSLHQGFRENKLRPLGIKKGQVLGTWPQAMSHWTEAAPPAEDRPSRLALAGWECYCT